MAEQEITHERFMTRSEIQFMCQGRVEPDLADWFAWLMGQELYAVGFLMTAVRVMPVLPGNGGSNETETMPGASETTVPDLPGGGEESA